MWQDTCHSRLQVRPSQVWLVRFRKKNKLFEIKSFRFMKCDQNLLELWAKPTYPIQPPSRTKKHELFRVIYSARAWASLVAFTRYQMVWLGLFSPIILDLASKGNWTFVAEHMTTGQSDRKPWGQVMGLLTFLSVTLSTKYHCDCTGLQKVSQITPSLPIR